jgi:predicted deacylase
MAKIIVTADHTTHGAPAVLLEESVHAVHLSTAHAAAQLLERLNWALRDAEELEGRRAARPMGSRAHGRSHRAPQAA